jgi:hypothetical protein
VTILTSNECGQHSTIPAQEQSNSMVLDLIFFIKIGLQKFILVIEWVLDTLGRGFKF